MVENEDVETGELLGLLSKYETKILSPTWVEAVIDTDYTECEALPAQFEEQHMQTNWVSLLSETGESFCTQNNLDHQCYHRNETDQAIATNKGD